MDGIISLGGHFSYLIFTQLFCGKISTKIPQGSVLIILSVGSVTGTTQVSIFNKGQDHFLKVQYSNFNKCIGW